MEGKCICFGHEMNAAVQNQYRLTQCFKTVLHTAMYVGIHGQILLISTLHEGNTAGLLFQRNIVMVTVEHLRQSLVYPHRAGTRAHVCTRMHMRAKEEEEKNRRQRHVCGEQKNREMIQPERDARALVTCNTLV